MTEGSEQPARHPALALVEAVLFDKDGTLLDFDATWGPATAEVLRELSGGDAALFERLAASCGFLPETGGFLPDSPVIGGYTDDFAPAWATILGRPYDEAFKTRVDALFRAASLRHLTAYADVAAALAALRDAGLPIGLATNDSEATAKAHLHRLAIADLFDFVAGYDSGHGAKPGSGMVTRFAAAVDVAPLAVALVGDSPHDMHAAIGAGAVPVGIVRTERAAGQLGDLPSLTVPDLAGLLAGLGLSDR
ncbi:phosphatase [Aureimonas endophytica]|uniref:phosphoglycolate phosphatase n=1 Tax=Aureimonas endophytica TaxID=2027858 RepID=A0A916ZFG8_9HYPH|nr:HAD-IA family hydrolase [Aureimonas endophytica]GGD92709.1 phosphatase [Aureimonas endophytica]